MRCHSGNIFQYFDELFAGTSYIRLRQKNHVDDMSRFSILCNTGRFKRMGDKLVLVLLNAAGQPENINCEN